MNLNMEMKKVYSSYIKEVGYDQPGQVLRVHTTDGIYEYKGVPIFIYEQFMNSSSFGRFYDKRIKNKFPETEMF